MNKWSSGSILAALGKYLVSNDKYNKFLHKHFTFIEHIKVLAPIEIELGVTFLESCKI